MNKERSSGQDNASREGVGELWEDVKRAAHEAKVAEMRAASPSSARTSAETPQADCPPSQSKDVT